MITIITIIESIKRGAGDTRHGEPNPQTQRVGWTGYVGVFVCWLVCGVLTQKFLQFQEN